MKKGGAFGEWVSLGTAEQGWELVCPQENFREGEKLCLARALNFPSCSPPTLPLPASPPPGVLLLPRTALLESNSTQKCYYKLFCLRLHYSFSFTITTDCTYVFENKISFSHLIMHSLPSYPHYENHDVLILLCN